VLHGGIKPKARRAALAQLAEQSDSEPRLILATGRYLGEGFDDPRLDTLLLTMPIAWKGTVRTYKELGYACDGSAQELSLAV
jgi:superfamily II DNA or RNA helicase